MLEGGGLQNAIFIVYLPQTTEENVLGNMNQEIDSHGFPGSKCENI